MIVSRPVGRHRPTPPPSREFAEALALPGRAPTPELVAKRNAAVHRKKTKRERRTKV